MREVLFDAVNDRIEQLLPELEGAAERELVGRIDPLGEELLIAVALIVVLRLKPSGVLPERVPPAPRPS